MNELSSVGKQAAFNAGLETARQMALTAAVTIEVREDAAAIRQQAAAAALQGLAEGLRAAFLERQAEPASSLHLQVEPPELRS